MWMLVKTAWPVAWTWSFIALDNSPKHRFIALIPTLWMQLPTNEFPCSASDNSVGVGNLWGTWPQPAQPSGFHTWLFLSEDVPVMQAWYCMRCFCAHILTGNLSGSNSFPAPPASDQTCVWSLSVWLNRCWKVQSLLLILETIIDCSITHFLHYSLFFFTKIFNFSIVLGSLASYSIAHSLKY